MANRPVYVPFPTGESFVITHAIEFEWFAGMSKSQKQKSIDSLHKAALTIENIKNPLEISSKSSNPLGVQLSAFNLMIENKSEGSSYSVENAFQAGKVFEDNNCPEGGGPYLDLLHKTPREARSDPRLKGQLKKFHRNGRDWLLEPMTVFYDWIYINARYVQQKRKQFESLFKNRSTSYKSISRTNARLGRS